MRGAVLSMLLATAAYGQPTVEEQVVAQERTVLDALKRGDRDTISLVIADDAVFLHAYGAATKAEELQHVTEFRLKDYAMSEVRVMSPSIGTALLTYRLAEIAVAQGKELSVKGYISSLWVKREGKWLCVFSQETPAR